MSPSQHRCKTTFLQAARGLRRTPCCMILALKEFSSPTRRGPHRCVYKEFERVMIVIAIPHEHSQQAIRRRRKYPHKADFNEHESLLNRGCQICNTCGMQWFIVPEDLFQQFGKISWTQAVSMCAASHLMVANSSLRQVKEVEVVAPARCVANVTTVLNCCVSEATESVERAWFAKLTRFGLHDNAGCQECRFPQRLRSETHC